METRGNFIKIMFQMNAFKVHMFSSDLRGKSQFLLCLLNAVLMYHKVIMSNCRL